MHLFLLLLEIDPQDLFMSHTESVSLHDRISCIQWCVPISENEVFNGAVTYMQHGHIRYQRPVGITLTKADNWIAGSMCRQKCKMAGLARREFDLWTETCIGLRCHPCALLALR